MYLVAGIGLERISGQRWEDFIRDRILLPLGMERATTSLEDMLARHSDYAAPHAVLDDVQRRTPVRPINTRPGGGICAAISYVGRSDFAEVGQVHYGFGFEVVSYCGARRVSHGGGWSGYNCDLRLLPDHGSGVMVLTNGHDSGCAALTNSVLDRLLGLEPLPWLERLSRPRATMRDHKLKDRSAREEARHRKTRPSHALADYASEYARPAYGKVRISRDGDVLRWHGLGLDLPMAHRHYDVFEISAEPSAWFENKTVQFATGVEGHIESLAFPLEPAVAPIVFRRRRNPRWRPAPCRRKPSPNQPCRLGPPLPRCGRGAFQAVHLLALSCIAGEGAERSEAGEGLRAAQIFSQRSARAARKPATPF
jgi:hypothetical protein